MADHDARRAALLLAREAGALPADVRAHVLSSLLAHASADDLEAALARCLATLPLDRLERTLRAAGGSIPHGVLGVARDVVRDAAWDAAEAAMRCDMEDAEIQQTNLWLQSLDPENDLAAFFQDRLAVSVTEARALRHG